MNKKQVYVVAEIGVNHNGLMENAFHLIDLAKMSGADAVKFQTFKAAELARRFTPKVNYQLSATFKDESHFEMLKKLELLDSDYQKLLEYCNDKNIDFISTPYSVNAVELLNKIGVKQFKVASADIVDIPLLEAIAKTGKPVMLSLGMASMGEIEKALDCFGDYPDEDLALLHCVSNYPCSDSSLNLRVINSLRAAFNKPIGFSDHSVGDVAAIVAVSLGAGVVEKHFTSDKNLPGPDHNASSTPVEFLSLVKSIRRCEYQLGVPKKIMQAEEIDMAKTSRKSLVYSCDIIKGTTFIREHFTMMRPGGGLLWEDVQHFIGRTSKVNCNHQSGADFKHIE